MQALRPGPVPHISAVISQIGMTRLRNRAASGKTAVSSRSWNATSRGASIGPGKVKRGEQSPLRIISIGIAGRSG